MDEVLERARDLDPTVLYHAARLLPGAVWVGPLLVLIGAILLFGGAHPKLLRFTVGILGAWAGLLFTPAVVPGGVPGLPPAALPWAGACALGILGAVWPVAVAFVCCGLAGAHFTARLVPVEDPFLKAVPGAVFFGVLGAFLVKAVAKILSALAGTLMGLVGCVALLLHFGIGDFVRDWPVAPLFPAVVLFLAGAAWQLTRGEPQPQKKQRQKPALEPGGAA